MFSQLPKPDPTSLCLFCSSFFKSTTYLHCMDLCLNDGGAVTNCTRQKRNKEQNLIKRSTTVFPFNPSTRSKFYSQTNGFSLLTRITYPKMNVPTSKHIHEKTLLWCYSYKNFASAGFLYTWNPFKISFFENNYFNLAPVLNVVSLPQRKTSS